MEDTDSGFHFATNKIRQFTQYFPDGAMEYCTFTLSLDESTCFYTKASDSSAYTPSSFCSYNLNISIGLTTEEIIRTEYDVEDYDGNFYKPLIQQKYSIKRYKTLNTGWRIDPDGQELNPLLLTLGLPITGMEVVSHTDFASYFTTKGMFYSKNSVIDTLRIDNLIYGDGGIMDRTGIRYTFDWIINQCRSNEKTSSKIQELEDNVKTLQKEIEALKKAK